MPSADRSARGSTSLALRLSLPFLTLLLLRIYPTPGPGWTVSPRPAHALPVMHLQSLGGLTLANFQEMSLDRQLSGPVAVEIYAKPEGDSFLGIRCGREGFVEEVRWTQVAFHDELTLLQVQADGEAHVLSDQVLAFPLRPPLHVSIEQTEVRFGDSSRSWTIPTESSSIQTVDLSVRVSYQPVQINTVNVIDDAHADHWEFTGLQLVALPPMVWSVVAGVVRGVRGLLRIAPPRRSQVDIGSVLLLAAGVAICLPNRATVATTAILEAFAGWLMWRFLRAFLGAGSMLRTTLCQRLCARGTVLLFVFFAARDSRAAALGSPDEYSFDDPERIEIELGDVATGLVSVQGTVSGSRPDAFVNLFVLVANHSDGSAATCIGVATPGDAACVRELKVAIRRFELRADGNDLRVLAEGVQTVLRNVPLGSLRIVVLQGHEVDTTVRASGRRVESTRSETSVGWLVLIPVGILAVGAIRCKARYKFSLAVGIPFFVFGCHYLAIALPGDPLELVYRNNDDLAGRLRSDPILSSSIVRTGYFARVDDAPVRYTTSDRQCRLIVTFGGSSTFGIGADPGETYPEILERSLSGGNDDCWVVRNVASPGASSLSAPVLYEQVISQLKPDLVIASYSFNDRLTPVLSEWETGGPDTLGSLFWLRRRSFLGNLLEPLRRLSVLGIVDPDQLQAIGKRSERAKVDRLEANLRALVRATHNDGGGTILVPEPTYDTWLSPQGEHRIYHDAVRRAATEPGAVLASVTEALSEAHRFDDIFIDNVHMNARGQRLLGEYLSSIVRERAPLIPKQDPRLRL